MSPHRTTMPVVCAFTFACLLSIVGCYNPHMYQGGPYGQPMYAPPQNLAPGYGPAAPGTLYIPESNAPLYEPSSPGSTYENGVDSWQPSPGSGSGSSTDGQFYEGGVPQPREPNSGGSMFDEDLGRPSTQLTPSRSGATQAVDAAVTTVSTRRVIPQYGFDENDYRWLRGILRFDESSQRWNVTYSLTEADRYRGDFNLLVDPQHLQGLRSGDAVDVRGQVVLNQVDSRGRPLYRVQNMQKMAIRIAS